MGPSATLSATKQGLGLVLANGGPTTAWIHAGDSNILAYLEAKDANGLWRPIEYKPWYTCGNSYHRLGLPASEGWQFEISIPRGSLKSKVRWRYYGRNGESELLSNEVEFSLPPTRFKLEPILTATCEVSTRWGPPTLIPKPHHVPPPVR
jgi:hypothetical protein